MPPLTPRSKKNDIWREKERLEDETRSAQRRALVLERDLEALRKELGLALERRAFAEKQVDLLRQKSEKLELLTRLTRDLASFDVEKVYRACVERIPYIADARWGSLYLYDDVQNQLRLKQKNHSREIDTVVDLTTRPGSLMAQAIRTRSLLMIEELGSYKRDDGSEISRPNRERYNTSSCVVAPLLAGDEILGVINLADHFDNRPFSKTTDLEIVQQAADLVALSLSKHRLFDQVQRATHTDALTNLPNHRATLERLQLETNRAKRYKHGLALVVVNLDKFGLLNANYGPAGGDMVLQQAAKLIRASVRDVDIPGRTGGDEFAVILPEQTLKGAQVVAERLARVFGDQRFRIGRVDGKNGPDDLVAARATVGVTQVDPNESASEALQRAKEAIAEARSDGKSWGSKT